MLQFSSQGCLLQNSLLFRAGQSFLLFGPSADEIRPTTLQREIYFYSESTDLNVNPIQKHPHRNRIMFDHIQVSPTI